MIYNPLSFSQNVHQDLGLLVRNALSGLGVSEELLNNFDSHSTIAIDMDTGFSINLSLVDDRLFIWSFLPLSKEILLSNSRSILSALASPVEYVEMGRLVLGECDGGFELKALTNLDALKEDKLGLALTNFNKVINLIVSVNYA